MDRPEELFCPGCRARLGYETDRVYVWNCACGRKLCLAREGRVREASPEFMDIVRRLSDAEAAFNRKAEEFKVYSGGGRGQPSTLKLPDETTEFLNSGCVLVILVGLGIALLFTRAWPGGIALIPLGVGVFSWMKKGQRQRLDGLRELEAEYNVERSDLEEQLRRL